MQYYSGLILSIWNCVNNPATLDGFGECASSVAESILPPEIMFDMVECQTAEVSYRIITFVISLMTPLMYVIYTFTKYPAYGYYAVNDKLVDENLNRKGEYELVQARPLECAFASLLMSMNTVQWAVNALMQITKALVIFLQFMQAAAPDLQEIYKFHRTAATIVLRTIVFVYRDFYVAVMEIARVMATIVELEMQLSEGDEFPNPRIPAQSFTNVQIGFMSLVSMFESFIELFSDIFFLELKSPLLQNGT